MTRISTVLAAAATGLVLGAALLIPPSAAWGADAPTCQGRAGTIVGIPGQAVTGTAGSDVIVARDPVSVDAGDGDDLVCVVSDAAAPLRVDVDLGAGADTYVGPGAIYAVLDAGDGADVAEGRAPSIDHVTTGDLGDLVITGADGYADADVVDLGNGSGSRNRLRLSGVPTGSFVSGDDVEGSSELRLTESHRHDWSIDLQSGTVAIDGGASVTVSGFQQLTARDLTWSRLAVAGTSDADSVDLGGSALGRGRVAVHLGAGEDSVSAPATLRGSLDLGRGGDHRRHEDGDEAYLTGPRTPGHVGGSITVRLDRGTHVDGHSGPKVVNAEGVSLIRLAHVRLIGTSAPESLSVTGCVASVSGGGGADHIRLHRAGNCRRTGTFAAYGGAGADRLTGTPGRDRLIGGPGRDRACGNGGPDVISAELPC